MDTDLDLYKRMLTGANSNFNETQIAPIGWAPRDHVKTWVITDDDPNDNHYSEVIAGFSADGKLEVIAADGCAYDCDGCRP